MNMNVKLRKRSKRCFEFSAVYTQFFLQWHKMPLCDKQLRFSMEKRFAFYIKALVSSLLKMLQPKKKYNKMKNILHKLKRERGGKKV